jgi:hypothetical protein
MSTPKEKAARLVELFWAGVQAFSLVEAKEAALVAIDEIIDAVDWHEFEMPNTELEYWTEVKQEIEKFEIIKKSSYI